MYTTDKYFDAVHIVSDMIQSWEKQSVHQDWELSLAESIIAALTNAKLLK